MQFITLGKWKCTLYSAGLERKPMCIYLPLLDFYFASLKEPYCNFCPIQILFWLHAVQTNCFSFIAIFAGPYSDPEPGLDGFVC